MQAVAFSSASHGCGTAPGAAYSSSSSPSTCFTSAWTDDSDPSSSGSTHSTEAPECSTM